MKLKNYTEWPTTLLRELINAMYYERPIWATDWHTPTKFKFLQRESRSYRRLWRAHILRHGGDALRVRAGVRDRVPRIAASENDWSVVFPFTEDSVDITIARGLPLTGLLSAIHVSLWGDHLRVSYLQRDTHRFRTVMRISERYDAIYNQSLAWQEKGIAVMLRQICKLSTRAGSYRIQIHCDGSETLHVSRHREYLLHVNIPAHDLDVQNFAFALAEYLLEPLTDVRARAKRLRKVADIAARFHITRKARTKYPYRHAISR